MLAMLFSSPVIAAIVAGGFAIWTVLLGLKRYKTERWWERKASTYAAIVEVLHTIEDVQNERIQAIEKSVQLPVERVDKIRILERDAHTEVRKYTNQGGFIITDRAAKALKDLTLILEQQPHDTLDRYYNDRAVAAGAAITLIKREASLDLGT